MGTRAQFFINDPRDLEKRIWLGCIAYDGYPDGDCEALANCKTERMFLDAVAKLKGERDDFCDPNKHAFPFPWKDDLFLTDCTYAFFGGEVQFTYFHRGFVPLAKYNSDEAFRESYSDGNDELSGSVPAPTTDESKPLGPDSIMIISA